MQQLWLLLTRHYVNHHAPTGVSEEVTRSMSRSQGRRNMDPMYEHCTLHSFKVAGKVSLQSDRQLDKPKPVWLNHIN